MDGQAEFEGDLKTDFEAAELDAPLELADLGLVELETPEIDLTPSEAESLEGLGIFLKQVRKYPLLTKSEEVMLAKRIEEGDGAAYDRFVNSNLRLVVSNARRYTDNGLELLDLIQHGTIGLLRAAEKFDWRRDLKFSTYATWWIKQGIQRGLGNESRTIRVPLHVHQEAVKIGRSEGRLTTTLGRSPSIEEIAEDIGMPADKVSKIRESVPFIDSLDKPIDDDGKANRYDLLADEVDVVEELGERDEYERKRATMHRALLRMPERMADVIRLRYGLEGHQPLTLEQVGMVIGVTRERIRQIERQALGELERLVQLPEVNDDEHDWLYPSRSFREAA